MNVSYGNRKASRTRRDGPGPLGTKPSPHDLPALKATGKAPGLAVIERAEVGQKGSSTPFVLVLRSDVRGRGESWDIFVAESHW